MVLCVTMVLLSGLGITAVYSAKRVKEKILVNPKCTADIILLDELMSCLFSIFLKNLLLKF